MKSSFYLQSFRKFCICYLRCELILHQFMVFIRLCDTNPHNAATLAWLLICLPLLLVSVNVFQGKQLASY